MRPLTLWLFRDGRFFRAIRGRLVKFQEKTPDRDAFLFYVKGVKLNQQPLVVHTMFPCGESSLRAMPSPVVIIEYDRPSQIPELIREMHRLGEFNVYAFDDPYARAVNAAYTPDTSSADDRSTDADDQTIEKAAGKLTVCGYELKAEKLLKVVDNEDGSQTTSVGCLGCGAALLLVAVLVAIALFLKVLLW